MTFKKLDHSKLDPERKFIEPEINPGDKYFCIECANCGHFIPIAKNTENSIPTWISDNEGDGLMTACGKCRHEQAYKVEDIHFLTAE